MITLNASDPDLGLNGEIKYNLEPSDSSEDFQLNSQTGLLSVASELDRETKEFYDLTTTCKEFEVTKTSPLCPHLDLKCHCNDR